jgi:hypothetical protein
VKFKARYCSLHVDDISEYTFLFSGIDFIEAIAILGPSDFFVTFMKYFESLKCSHYTPSFYCLCLDS